MRLDIEIIIIIMILLLFADLILAIRLIISKLKRDDKREIQVKHKNKLIAKWVQNKSIGRIRPYYDIFSQARHLIKLDDETESNVSENLRSDVVTKRSIRKLKSVFRLNRIEAANNISMLGTKEAARMLEKALVGEKKLQVKLYLANAISDIGDEESVPVLVSSLLGENRWYREKVNMLIADLGSKACLYIPELMKRDEIEIVDFIVDMASVYPSDNLKKYIFELINNYDRDRQHLMEAARLYKKEKACQNCVYRSGADIIDNDKCRYHKWVENDKACRSYKSKNAERNLLKHYDEIILKAADAAIKYYFIEFAVDKYLTNRNADIRKKAVEALSNIKSLDSIKVLKEMMSDEETAKTAQIAISEIIQEKPEFTDEVSEMLLKERDANTEQLLAESLSRKIEYFIMKVISDEKEQAERIIEKILLLGKTSEFIGFLNNNKDKAIEEALIKILLKVLDKREDLKEEFMIYLNAEVLKRAGLESLDKPLGKKEYDHKPTLIRSLFIELIVVVLVFPLIYIIRHYSDFGIWSWLKHIKIYIIDFNYYLAFYSILINSIYLILIGLSKLNVKRQAKIWALKNDKMLFKKRMLPGISIIAPAYNEQNVIVESANSLLNLKYPDYDLIIVNDGSTDNTLGVLIEYYELDRIDYAFDRELNVAPIRGIYRNPAYPKLLVVDTENAGKADSLNSGIMISNKEYFCCIDSDSLLENDALLKLASQTLDEEVETPALGGNVYPINGCDVSKGHIEKKRIPKNTIARFQTIEYIRAFMAGRLGWAYLNSLLIISGAFGIFRKERVIKVGGYLTKNSKYNKDTVGEDMELVVRISRLMNEQKKKFKINYCYNANCWTEVPEEYKQLRRQRLRWYRGLAETIHFHIRTLFNPKYKRMGMIGMPYFFLFEMLGPLIEVQGYIMVLMAFILGILSLEIALLLFVASVMLGVLVSIISLMIAETENSYYGYRDILRLIGIAVIENFGPRQVFSFWRVAGFFNMFSKEHSWGEQARKGFAANGDQKGEQR